MLSTLAAWFQKVIAAVVADSAKIEVDLTAAEPFAQLLENLAPLLGPTGTKVVTTGVNLLSAAIPAVTAVDVAASAGGLNLTLDESVFTDIKAIAAQLESHPAAAAAGPKPTA